MGWWSDLWRTQTSDWVFARLTDEQAPESTRDDAIEPDSAYISMFLKSARVVSVRRGLKRFYGTVHSHVSVPHRDGKSAEFSVVTTPDGLADIDAEGIDHVIQLNRRLLGPVPYGGGDLDVEIGLFSIAASELAGPYLALLETLTRQAGVAFAGVALPFARPIVDGINLLGGAGRDSILEIGLATTLSPLRPGYYLAVRAPKTEFDVSTVRVDPTDSRLVGSQGEPIQSYPYMLVQIRTDDQRGDWFEIPDVATAYATVQANFRAGRTDETELSLAMFRRVVLTCNDLLPADAIRLAEKVDTLYSSRVTMGVTRGIPAGATLPDLEDLRLYD